MSLAAEAEKRRDFEPEILAHSDITAVQDGIERKYDAHEAQLLHPQEKDDLSTISHSWSAGWWRSMSISGLFRRLRRS
ncbi:hypothetical protein QP888_10270 [Corynebacterium sp. MSK297]|uniref:hypothetical protein n=1 Tax=Corynebacterium sp. MSK297 TaxID=3050221 RepID=UPI00254FA1B9|nr:hypothetical protein [Corynebacterium sp. MSK297]MDK8846864.1 hypothetical protein [Corynebacterium sp. MSK297]